MTTWGWWLLGALLVAGALTTFGLLARRLWRRIRDLGRGVAAAGERLAAAAPGGGTRGYDPWDDAW